jgi:hypothetical protein
VNAFAQNLPFSGSLEVETGVWEVCTCARQHLPVFAHTTLLLMSGLFLSPEDGEQLYWWPGNSGDRGGCVNCSFHTDTLPGDNETGHRNIVFSVPATFWQL